MTPHVASSYNRIRRCRANASLLDCWLFWLLHANRYDREALRRLLRHEAILQATETIARIAEITEDKLMYDAREKAQRDQAWALQQSFREGEAVGLAKGESAGLAKGEAAGLVKGEAAGLAKGKIELIRTLQQILQEPVSEERELSQLDLARLEEVAAALQQRVRARPS